jgi:hypothetical protein
MGHLCGLCLTLRDGHGQASRLTTNRDAVVLSALYEAQVGDVVRTRAAPCPLRGFRRADVVASSGPGVRFAAAVTLLLASIAVDDRVTDGELGPAVVGRPASWVAGRWRREALRDATALGFDAQALLQIVGEQAELEASVGRRFEEYSAPTEASVGAVFRHTAVLADQPGNADGLAGVGRMFGRVVYLVDAWQDRAADRAHGRFNAFDAADPGEDGPELFRATHRELRRRLDTVDLKKPALVRSLLVDGLHRTGQRIFAGDRRDAPPPKWVTGLLAGCAAAVGSCGVCTVCVRKLEDACTCNDCDCECTDCDCSGCDCSGCECDCSGCDCNC